MNVDEIKEEHESYAVINISRASCSEERRLFDSSITHHHLITLSISPAVKSRHLNKDWIHGKGLPYIEVEMSESQFAQAITSLNRGDGTPVTLKHIIKDGKYLTIPEPPFESKRMQFDQEFEERMKKLANALQSYQMEIKEQISTLSKKKQEEVNQKIDELMKEIRSNIPFIKRSFTEQMDKTVTEAKGEVESFFSNKIRQIGLENMNVKEILTLPETETQEEKVVACEATLTPSVKCIKNKGHMGGHFDGKTTAWR